MQNSEMSRVILSAYVRDLIDQWRREQPAPAYAEVGRRLNCTKEHALAIHQRGVGVGSDVESNIANHLHAGSVDALRKAAVDWWKAGGEDVHVRRIVQTVMRDLVTGNDERRAHYAALAAEETLTVNLPTTLPEEARALFSAHVADAGHKLLRRGRASDTLGARLAPRTSADMSKVLPAVTRRSRSSKP